MSAGYEDVGAEDFALDRIVQTISFTPKLRLPQAVRGFVRHAMV